ncbi:hypothetical protein AB0E01_17055 [Nocardia vinacea]|uniref:hypothetical protein n=1 Tax=Nocardia vinacea TaxID=96468 RepID=UPI00341123C6
MPRSNRGTAKRRLEQLLWLRTLVIAVDLATRYLPQSVENADANPAIKVITGLAAWMLHTIGMLHS